MGITCRIVRDSNGNINYLETTDGQRSNLFDNLRSLYGTEKALEYYALTESENFKDVQEVKKEDFTFSGQETLNKLKETGLADNVYQMTSEEIEAKLIELGVEADVAKQVAAYHGSPYSFDRFTTEKMGTGEGAQAFGWGLYFTDLESIAKNYAEKLSDVTFEGKPYGNDNVGLANATILLVRDAGSVDKAIENLNKLISEKGGSERSLSLLEFLNTNSAKYNVKKNLYKVSLHKGKTPSEYTWLEWDRDVPKKQLDEISKNVLDKTLVINTTDIFQFQKNGKFYRGEKTNNEWKFIDRNTGESVAYSEVSNAWQELYNEEVLDKKEFKFYKRLEDFLESDKNASLFLLESGIDGIKYPAESISRGATSDTARGFNYVVFDENAITIEEQIQFSKSGITPITNGFIYKNDVYLNKNADESTMVHEFNHLYNKWLKQNRPEVYKKGLDLVKAELKKKSSEIQDIIDFVKTNQPDLEGEKLFEEILTELVGRKGLELLIKEKNKAKSSGIIDWLSEVWKEIKSMLGISSMSDDEVLKLNLEDFTKASATDLLSGSKLSKKETVKVEKNEVNGKLVYEPFFKGKKMGALRLLPYNGGYRVDSVVVYDKFQKKGVARNLYKYAINDLSKQGISISSLNIRAPYAEKIWEGLVNEGIATKDGNDYRAFREPKVSEVLEYANETEEPLTKEQSVQAIDTLASFGINNSLELFEKLKEAFVKDGAIVFDRKKLEKAGYNSYEITSILTNRDLQQQIKENIYKVKNTELSIDLEGLEVLKTDEVNIFGKQSVYVNSEREAVNEIVDGEIKSKKTDTLQTLNKTYPKTLPEIDTRPFETILKVTENVAKNNPEKLKKVAQAMQEEALKYGVDLRGIENKIYPIQRLKNFTESLVNYISEPNNNFSEVYDKFFEVSQLPKAENEGNDVKLDTELSEYELFRDHNLVRKEGNTYTKVSPENIEDLYNYFFRQQEKINQIKSKDFKTWFGDWENNIRESSKIVDKNGEPLIVYHGSDNKISNGFINLNPNIVGFFFSNDKENARTYGKFLHKAYLNIKNPLIIDTKGSKFTDDLPVKVLASYPNQEPYETEILLDLDEIVYMVKVGKRSNSFIEIKNREDYDGIIFKNLIDPSLSSKRETPQDTIVSFRNDQIKIIDKEQFKTKEDIQARTPELEVEDYQTDSDVLEALFIWKNFLGYTIKTKSNKKSLFKGMTNNPFKVVTADGIVLKNNDTLTRAKADLYEEEVVKQDVDYQDEVREKVSLGEITPEKIKTDYTIIEDGVLMTKNNTNQFLRTPLANYELIYQDGNLSFYKDVLGAEKNLSDIDFTKYLNESVKPDNYIVAKNSYSKQELEEINNKYFSCK